MSGELFNVCQFFANDSYEYVRRAVDGKEAVNTALDYATSVGARIGSTKRVIVTDGGDSCVFEWQYGKGVTFPPGHEGQPVPAARVP